MFLRCSAASAKPTDTLAQATGSGRIPSHMDVSTHNTASLLATDADTFKRL